MVTRRWILRAAGCAALVPVAGSGQATPDMAGTSVPGVVSITDPTDLIDDVIVSQHRVVSMDGGRWTMVLGVLQNVSDDVRALRNGLNVTVRDHDGLILGSYPGLADYPVVPPSARIGFHAAFHDLAFDGVNTQDVRFTGEESESGRRIEAIARATLEVERAEEISRDGDLEVELVVRNTSDEVFAALEATIAVWDNDLYCGSSNTFVSAEIPPGEAARFTTSSNTGSLNPVTIAGSGFTWEPWIVPGVDYLGWNASRMA